METLLTIITIWFVASIPATLILARMLGATSRMHEEATAELLAAATVEAQPVAVR
jgi:hypothetical protein